MSKKPTYKELKLRIQELENTLIRDAHLKEESESIYELSPDIIGFGNLDGYFTKINSSFIKKLGYLRNELLKKPFLTFVHDDDVERTKKALIDAQEGKRKIRIENRYRCKDGSYKWIDWYVLSLVHRNKFIAIGRDITSRKQVEEAFRESEERLKSQYKSIPIPTYTWQKKRNDLVLVNYNKAAEKISEGKIADFLNIKAREMYHDTPKIVDDMEQCLAEKAAIEYEIPYTLKTTGARKHLAVKYAFSPPDQVIVHTEDITDRITAQEKLIEVQERLKATLASMHDLVFVLDRDGNFIDYYQPPNDINLYAPSTEFIGRSYVEVLPETAAKPIGEAIDAVMRTGEVQEVEYALDVPVGRRWFHAKLSRMGHSHDTIAGVTVVVRDVTDKKKFEEERLLMQKRSYESKVESLERMAGAVAHLFNNQLAVIIGNLELIEEDLPPEANASGNLSEALKAALRAAETSGFMITLLGQVKVTPVSFDIAHACRTQLAGLESDIPANEIVLRDLPDPGPIIWADPAQLGLVVDALVTNAREAMEGRGQVRVAVQTVKAEDIAETNRFPVGWEPEAGSYACLEVTDNGCGMDDGTIGKIFDPFFTDKFTGRGLGLPMVLGTIKANGGVITVESKPGKGSAFRVFYPLSAETVRRPEPDKDVDKLLFGHAGIVLLVDDQEMVRKMGRTMLGRLGFEVITAKDGAEAVETFRERAGDICLVLTDLTMPRMNGWETLAALRKIRPDIPVILTSGYDEAQASIGDHADRPDAYLYKPYQKKTLLETLRKVLG